MHSRQCDLSRSLLLCGLFLEPPIALAQLWDDAPRALDLAIPQVISPSRFPQRLDESPSSVTIIDRAMIEASGARNLIDVLRLVPGFYVGYRQNDLPSAGFHGLADEFARRALLLVDGQRIFQYSRGIIEWNNIPLQLEDVERIEVVRGPNAAVYGSNAFQAVIDIQTRSPAENQGLYVRGTVGSQDVLDGFARYGSRLGALDYSVSLFSKRDSGYDDVPDDRQNTGITAVGDWALSATSTLKLRAGYSRGDYQTPNDSSLPADPDDPWRDFKVSDNYQSIEWRRLFNNGTELTATLAHNRFAYDDPGYQNHTLAPNLTLNVAFDIEEERTSAEIKAARALSDQLRIVAGIGYHYEAITAPFYFDTDETLDNGVLRLFANGEYRISEQLVVNLGAMLENAEIGNQDWLFLPRLSAHYHLNDQHTVRAIFSTGSRQPTLYSTDGKAITEVEELPVTVYRVIASGNLSPEYNRSIELGYHWSIDRASHLDMRVYYEHLSDLIVPFSRPGPPLPPPAPTLPVLDFANENDLAVSGVELQYAWRHTSGFNLFASYAYTDIDADDARYDSGYAASVPRHTIGLLLSQGFGKGWQASLNYDYQSDLQWLGSAPIDAYHKLDLRLAKRFNTGNSGLLAEIVGTNLLGSINDFRPDRTSDSGIFFRLSADF